MSKPPVLSVAKLAPTAQPDDTVYLALNAAMAHVFDGVSGARLG